MGSLYSNVSIPSIYICIIIRMMSARRERKKNAYKTYLLVIYNIIIMAMVTEFFGAENECRLHMFHRKNQMRMKEWKSLYYLLTRKLLLIFFVCVYISYVSCRVCTWYRRSHSREISSDDVSAFRFRILFFFYFVLLLFSLPIVWAKWKNIMLYEYLVFLIFTTCNEDEFYKNFANRMLISI